MPRGSRRDRAALLAVLLVTASVGCEGKTVAEPTPRKRNDETETKAPVVDPPVDTNGKSPDAKAGTEAPDAKLGRTLDGPLPIAGLLGKPPAEVQAQLSEPLGKGMVRKSCVRFVPERTWFECQFATQRYGDKTGAYAAIGVEYQDGKSTAVAFEGPKRATGPFDARAALAYVGLELPGEPKVEKPEGDAVVYSWFNASARLRVDGRQYRVVVSTVGDDWARTKIEVILNDPLDEAERARIIERPTEPGQ